MNPPQSKFPLHLNSREKGESSPFPKLLSLCSGEAQFWDRGIGAKVVRGDTEVGPQGRDEIEAEVKGDRQSETIVNPEIKL